MAAIISLAENAAARAIGDYITMKKLSIAMAVLGGALAAFGLTGFSASLDNVAGLSGWAGWDTASRVEVIIGVALFLLGKCLLKREPL